MLRSIVISGPTASGKSTVAALVAAELNGVIICADSMQVYEGLPILTAMPSAEDRQKLEHKLFATLSAGEMNFSVGKWLERARNEIELAISAGKVPIIVGGTGLYIKSLIHGIDQMPEISAQTKSKAQQDYQNLGGEALFKILNEVDRAITSKIKPGDKQRIIRAYEVWLQTGESIIDLQLSKLSWDRRFLHCSFQLPRDGLYQRIDRRFLQMLDAGAVAEVQHFRDRYDNADNFKSAGALGFREISLYLKGEVDYAKMTQASQQKTRNYAKRQITWFKYQAPESIVIDSSSAQQAAEQLLLQWFAGAR